MKTIGIKHPQGFSLIEFLVSIAVLSILIGIAVPSFQTWMLNSQIRNAAESIQNGLQRARAEAVSSNRKVEFILGTDSSWSIVFEGNGEFIDSRSSKDGSSSVEHTKPIAGGPTTVTFDGLGRIVSNSDISTSLSEIELDSKDQSLRGISRELRVTISPGGSIRMCDPNASIGSTRAC